MKFRYGEIFASVECYDTTGLEHRVTYSITSRVLFFSYGEDLAAPKELRQSDNKFDIKID